MRGRGCTVVVAIAVLAACGGADRAAYDERARTFSLPVVDTDLEPNLPGDAARLFVTTESIVYDPSPGERAAQTAPFEIAPTERARLAELVPHEEPTDPPMFGVRHVGDRSDADIVVVLADARLAAPSLLATLGALPRPSVIVVRAPRGLATLTYGGWCEGDDFDPRDVPPEECGARYTAFVTPNDVRVRFNCTSGFRCEPREGTTTSETPEGDLLVPDVAGEVNLADLTGCLSFDVAVERPNVYPAVVAGWDVDVQREAQIAAALEGVGWRAVALCEPHPGMPWEANVGVVEPPSSADWRHAPRPIGAMVSGSLWHRDAGCPSAETVAEPRSLEDEDSMALWLHTRVPFYRDVADASQSYVRARDRDGRDIIVFTFSEERYDGAQVRGASILIDGELVATIGPVHPATDADARAILAGQLMVDVPIHDCPFANPPAAVPQSSDPSTRVVRLAPEADCTGWRAYEATFDASGAPVTQITRL
jgi:hypothetical protein